IGLAGEWKVYLLLNDGYTRLAEASFKIIEPWAPLVRVGKPVYGIGEPITVTFTNGLANAKDWIGIYEAGQTPGGGVNSTLWCYVDGTTSGNKPLASGEVTFPTGLTKVGRYVAYFLINDGYEIAALDAFEVSGTAGLPRVVAIDPPNNSIDQPPVPRFSATIANAATKVVPNTVELTFDGTKVTPVVTEQDNNVVIRYQADTLLAAGSVHRFRLTFADTATPPNRFTNEVQYTVVNYQSITLPTPIVFEDFDSTPEGQLPPGWTEKNYTEVLNYDLDPTDLNSAFYAGWTVVSVDRFKGEFVTYSNPDSPQAWKEDYRRVLTENPRYVVNGKLATPLATGRMLFANSGYRNGRSQVQFLYSPDYDLRGKRDIHLVFHSLWEQNQDSIAAVEYSIDGGQSWLPIAYFLDGPDIILDAEGKVDAVATFNTVRGDIAMYYDPDDGMDKGGSYGAFIATPISPQLGAFVQARVNDDPRESKRVEVFRLTQADNQPKVKFRFAHAGSDSWYWGIDNFGLYSIPRIDPPTITTQPLNQTAYEGDAVTFTAAAGGVGPFTYQWLFNNSPIQDATGATFTIPRVKSTDAGVYKVRVTNSAGSTDSQPATLTVTPLPNVVAGVWNFGSERLGRSSGVGVLEFADGDVTAALVSFEKGQPLINGVEPEFMRVPAFAAQANGLNLTMPTRPVAGEGYINRYSMVWDLLLPWDVNWTPLFNTAPNNSNDADFYISNTGALGIGALGYSSAGIIQPDTWYRIVFAANLPAGRVTIYVNGSPVHTRTGGSLANGRFALYSDLDSGPDVRLFNEPTGAYTHELLVNSFAFISRELTPEEVAAMGGPTAQGIVLPAPSTPINLNNPVVAADKVIITWTGGNGPFQVQKRTSLNVGSWVNVGQPTHERSLTDTVTNSTAFYRVIGQ
ncbi:MAG: immunoglobulin domain-containing protein, partial [Verrucomicrobiae bacterium]|nr:immunoglobulin domain-containing protein [Verrucomicrobiae bacterium]